MYLIVGYVCTNFAHIFHGGIHIRLGGLDSHHCLQDKGAQLLWAERRHKNQENRSIRIKAVFLYRLLSTARECLMKKKCITNVLKGFFGTINLVNAVRNPFEVRPFFSLVYGFLERKCQAVL